MNKEIKFAYDTMREKDYLLRMGSKKVAKQLHVSVNSVVEARRLIREEKINIYVPKILIFDLEMAPMRAYVWKRWDQNISLEQTISESFILSYSAKWVFDANIKSEVLTPREVKECNDYRLVKSLWSLLNKADIVIAYNGNGADLPWLRSRCLVYGMPTLHPFFSVDPCAIVKRNFGFSSNKLDAIAGYLGINHKLETNFSLWKECMEGNESALSYLQEYNINDVKILEDIYLKLRPWIKNHPNMANIFDEDICPVCCCEKYEVLYGEYYYTKVHKYQLYRCDHCGTIFRDRKPIKDNVKNIICAR